jgi:hypothetical protein
MAKALIVTRADGSEREYASIREAQRVLHLHPPTIHRAIKHGKPLNKGPLCGWAFRYAGDPKPVFEPPPPPIIPEEYLNFPHTRAGAKEAGVAYYFTGYPCKHGHTSLRRVQGACTECLREGWEASKAARKAYFEEYRKRPEVVARAKAYYARHKGGEPEAKPTYKELMEQARVK